ncbi:MAG TPA: tetratricopeptide repeat protein [Burkholderiales bacterium]|nr:tetratricopeptide repeat protein [Burkholderiales bacterium]
MLSLATRLGCILIALAVALPARADDVQDAAKLLKAGQHKQALDLVNKVLAAKPRDAQARFLKGIIFTEQGKSKDAIEIFTKLTQDYPELPEPYNNLAVIYASQGQYDKARAALEQSIRTHPSYATAYENLGDVYAKLASQAYDKALQIDSSNAAAKNKLSLVRELVGRPSATAVATAPKEAAKEPAKPPVVLAEKPKPAAEKPAPAPAAADASAEILKAVSGWAQAWSKKDADAYLTYYAKDFKTPGGEARASWEKTRRARITAPKSISVGHDSPKVTMDGADRATVSFQQNYKSDVLKSNSRKTLVLVKADGGWKILEEKSG